MTEKLTIDERNGLLALDQAKALRTIDALEAERDALQTLEQDEAVRRMAAEVELVELRARVKKAEQRLAYDEELLPETRIERALAVLRGPT